MYELVRLKKLFWFFTILDKSFTPLYFNAEPEEIQRLIRNINSEPYLDKGYRLRRVKQVRIMDVPHYLMEDNLDLEDIVGIRNSISVDV